MPRKFSNPAKFQKCNDFDAKAWRNATRDEKRLRVLIQEKTTEDWIWQFLRVVLGKLGHARFPGRITTCLYTEFFIFREVPHNLKNEAKNQNRNQN